MTAKMIPLKPKVSTVGDFEVRRFLPSAQKRSVGPFIFFDEMGAVTLQDGVGMDVGPHPHIGLSTLTWMIEGESVHRDSLGFVQTITPGDVNLMTAGRGIVHSERTAFDGRQGQRRVHGLQVWIALPSDLQEIEPSFQHVKKADLPTCVQDGMAITVIAGQAFGVQSPLKVYSPTLYLDMKADHAVQVDLPNEQEEQAVFIVAGTGRLNEDAFQAGGFLVLPQGERTRLESDGAVHVMMLGGQALRTRRHLWWNFAATSKERIEQAKQDWQEGRFDPVIDEADHDRIPLPVVPVRQS